MRAQAFRRIRALSDKHGKVEEWVDARSFCYGVNSGIETFGKIESLLRPTLNDLGYELVVARMIGGARRTLQIMAEPLEQDRAMTVEDCAEVSHAVSAVLDVEDPIPGRYTLEVSSPGLDRPLVRKEDFERFAGKHIRLETSEPVEGRKRFKGELLGLVGEGDRLRLRFDEGEIELPLAYVRKARLELADDLIGSAGRARKSGPVESKGDIGR
ncbi:MAG: ribosome maturation factor RimP [Geminicoccaceae bacterium]